MATHAVTTGHFFRKCFDGRGVQPGIGFGEAKGTLVEALHHARQPTLALLWRAKQHDGMRAKQVDVHAGRSRHAAAVAGHLVHHDGRFRHAQTRAAVFGGQGDAQPTSIGHGAMELAWELTVFVTRQPVVVGEWAHHSGHAFANGALVVAEAEVHVWVRPWAPSDGWVTSA